MSHAAELAIRGTEELRDGLERSEEFPEKLKAVVCVRINRRRVTQKPSDSVVLTSKWSTAALTERI